MHDMCYQIHDMRYQIYNIIIVCNIDIYTIYQYTKYIKILIYINILYPVQ